jgi:hypothetical protein
MKNKGASTNSANRKITNARYNVVDSATLPMHSGLENYTSNVTDYNDGYSGLDMLID